MIGAAEAAANLSCEFKIAEKKEARHTKIKNGKVILVKETANSIFSISPINPGAISLTKAGINISMTKTKKNKLINRRLKIWSANLSDFFFPFDNSEV